MILIGIVTLSAVHSLWWAIVPMLAGWVIWLLTEAILASLQIKLALSGGPLVAQIIVLTMPAASHLAIHFRDDRRREADPRLAARSTLAAVVAPIMWTAATGAIGYGALVTSDVTPIRQFGAILAACTFSRGDPGDADLADRHAAAILSGAAGPPWLAVAGRGIGQSPLVCGLSPSRRDRAGGGGGRAALGAGHPPFELRNQLYQSISSKDSGRPRLSRGRVEAGRHRIGRTGRAGGQDALDRASSPC